MSSDLTIRTYESVEDLILERGWLPLHKNVNWSCLLLLFAFSQGFLLQFSCETYLSLKDFTHSQRQKSLQSVTGLTTKWGTSQRSLDTGSGRGERSQYILSTTRARVPTLCFHLPPLTSPPMICDLLINNTKFESNFILFHQKNFCGSGDTFFFFLLMVFNYLERLVVSSHKCLNVRKKITQEPY